MGKFDQLNREEFFVEINGYARKRLEREETSRTIKIDESVLRFTSQERVSTFLKCFLNYLPSPSGLESVLALRLNNKGIKA